MTVAIEMEQIDKQFKDEVLAALAKFNQATWPSDVGLSAEEFPFRIWRHVSRFTTEKSMASQKDQRGSFKEIADGMAKKMVSRKDGVMFLGEIVGHELALHDRAYRDAQGLLEHGFITAVVDGSVELQVSGMSERMEVDRAQVRRSRGAGVLIPGPNDINSFDSK